MIPIPGSGPESESPTPFTNDEEKDWIDVAGGILLPALCVYLDPFVFSTTGEGPTLDGPSLGRYGVFAYGEIFLGMTAFVLYRWLHCVSPFLSGILLAGSAFAFCIGFILLPYSIIGLIFLIGVLGFSPFVSCFAFARGYVRLNQLALAQQTQKRVSLKTAIGVLFAFALPLGAQLTVNNMVAQAVQHVLSGDTSIEERRLLRHVSWVVNLEPLVNAYREEQDDGKRKVFAEVFTDITGRNIEKHIRIRDD